MKTVCILLLVITIATVQCRRKTIDLATKPVNCISGEHKTTWSSMAHWGFENGCFKNSKYCADFLLHTCRKCSWFSKMMKETEVGTGTWCALTWWTWTLVVVTSILVIVILAFTLVTCLKCCCSKKQEYSELRE